MLYFIFLSSGIVLLVLALFSLKRLLAFVKNGERATGMVTRLEESTDDGDVFYLPVFEFKTQDNQEVVYRYHISRSPAKWAIGTKKTFIYNPHDLTSVRLLTYSIFSPAIILMAVAMVLIVIGGSYYLLIGYMQ
jgi:hypothetical protein